MSCSEFLYLLALCLTWDPAVNGLTNSSAINTCHFPLYSMQRTIIKKGTNLLAPLQVHLCSPVIIDGVCVRWRGWLDLERLDGVGRVEFDERAAEAEDAVLRRQVEVCSRRVKEAEEQRRRQEEEEEEERNIK